MIKSITFILSTGRIGSIFLAKQLDKHPELLVKRSPHHRKDSFRYLEWCNRAFGSGSYRQRLPLGAYYRWKFAAARRRTMNRWDGHYVEVNNYIFPLLPELKRAFPEANLVHVIRDPRTFIPSALNRGWCINRHDPRMKAFHTGEMTKDAWKTLTGAQQLAWYWMRTNAMILEAGPDMTILSETFFADDHKGFGDILDAIGVSRDFVNEVEFDNRTNTTKEFYVPKWEEWRQEWKDGCMPYFEEADRLFGATRFYADLLDRDAGG